MHGREARRSYSPQLTHAGKHLFGYLQAPGEIPFNGIYYDPPASEKYTPVHPRPKKPKALRIYECHVGMSSPEPKVRPPI